MSIMGIVNDRYVLAATALILLFSLIYMIGPGTEADENNGQMYGVASDVKAGENGNTFTFTDQNGEPIRCFYRGTVNEGDMCVITGSYSNDGNMFFVSKFSVKN